MSSQERGTKQTRQGKNIFLMNTFCIIFSFILLTDKMRLRLKLSYSFPIIGLIKMLPFFSFLDFAEVLRFIKFNQKKKLLIYDRNN